MYIKVRHHKVFWILKIQMHQIKLGSCKQTYRSNDGLQNDVKKHVLISRALLNAASLVLFKAEYVVAIVVAGLYTNVVHNMN